MTEITLAEKLDDIKKTIKQAEFTIWSLVFGTVILTIVLTLVISDKLYDLDSAYRGSLFYSLAIWTICYLVIAIYIMTRNISDYYVAMNLGFIDKSLKDAVMSLADSRSYFVSTIIEARVDSSLDQVEYRPIFTKKVVPFAVFAACFVFILITLSVSVTGPSFPWHLSRVFWPFTESISNTTVIENLTETDQVVKSGSVIIKASVRPQKSARVFISFDKKEWFHLDMVQGSVIVKNIRSDFEYFIATDDAVTRNFRIECVNPPSIKNVEFTIEPPEYTNTKTYTSSDTAIDALIGSKIKIKLNADKELKKSTILFNNGLKKQGTETEIVLRSSTSFHIELENKEGNVGKTDQYVIRAIPDLLPTVAILSPEKESAIGPSDIFSPIVIAKDDYGLKTLTMFYQKKGGIEQPIELVLKKGEIFSFELKPEQLGLKNGDSIIYYFEATDFCPHHNARATSGVNALHITDQKSPDKSAISKLEELLKDDKKMEKLGVLQKIKGTEGDDKSPGLNISPKMEKLINELLNVEENLLLEEQIEKKVLKELKEAAQQEKKQAARQKLEQQVKEMEQAGTNTTQEFVKTQSYKILVDKFENLESILMLLETRVDKKYKSLVEAYFRALAR